jgi:hypothetical protein
MFSRQTVYHLGHTSIPFYFSYFSGWILCFLPKQAQNLDSPTFCIVGIMAVYSTMFSFLWFFCISLDIEKDCMMRNSYILNWKFVIFKALKTILGK